MFVVAVVVVVVSVVCMDGSCVPLLCLPNCAIVDEFSCNTIAGRFGWTIDLSRTGAHRSRVLR